MCERDGGGGGGTTSEHAPSERARVREAHSPRRARARARRAGGGTERGTSPTLVVAHVLAAAPAVRACVRVCVPFVSGMVKIKTSRRPTAANSPWRGSESAPLTTKTNILPTSAAATAADGLAAQSTSMTPPPTADHNASMTTTAASHDTSAKHYDSSRGATATSTAILCWFQRSSACHGSTAANQVLFFSCAIAWRRCRRFFEFDSAIEAKKGETSAAREWCVPSALRDDGLHQTGMRAPLHHFLLHVWRTHVRRVRRLLHRMR